MELNTLPEFWNLREGSTREGANELVQKMLANSGEMGYDVARSVPTQEYLDLYARVKEDLATLGLEFPY